DLGLAPVPLEGIDVHELGAMLGEIFQPLPELVAEVAGAQKLPDRGVAFGAGLAEARAGALNRRGGIVELVGEPGGELAERGHLLEVAGLLLELQLEVPALEIHGANTFGNVPEEAVGGDGGPPNHP